MGIVEDLSQPLGVINPHSNSIIYGPRGAGKTTWASDAPEPAWVDFEDSSDTLQALLVKGAVIDGLGIYKPPTLEKTWTLCREIVSKKLHKTIVIDTTTRQQTQQLAEYVANHPSVTGLAKFGSTGRQTRDKFTYHLGDFGYSQRILDELYYWLAKQPIRVILICHAKEVYQKVTDQNGNESNQLIKIRPDLTPALAGDMQDLFSLVAYMTAKPGTPIKRKIQVNPTNLIEAKNRLNIQEVDLEVDKTTTYRRLYHVS